MQNDDSVGPKKKNYGFMEGYYCACRLVWVITRGMGRSLNRQLHKSNGSKSRRRQGFWSPNEVELRRLGC